MPEERVRDMRSDFQEGRSVDMVGVWELRNTCGGVWRWFLGLKFWWDCWQNLCDARGRSAGGEEAIRVDNNHNPNPKVSFLPYAVKE